MSVNKHWQQCKQGWMIKLNIDVCPPFEMVKTGSQVRIVESPYLCVYTGSRCFSAGWWTCPSSWCCQATSCRVPWWGHWTGLSVSSQTCYGTHCGFGHNRINNATSLDKLTWVWPLVKSMCCIIVIVRKDYNCIYFEKIRHIYKTQNNTI